MKLNKIFLLAGIMIAGMLASCSDDDDYEPGQVASGSQLQAVTFAENNISSVELDPTDPCTLALTVSRDAASASEAITVPVQVVTNTDGVFEVPATVSFPAGSAETTLNVTYDKAQVGTAYTLEVALDDAYVNPYLSSTRKTYAYTVQRVKWNEVGAGYVCDDFWFGAVLPTTIYQRDDQPLTYRLSNPYTDEFVSSMGDTPAGTYTPWIVINTTRNDGLSWNDWSYNVYHTSYGAEILPQFYANNADNCYVERNAEGGIRYFQLNPRFYMLGVGGWSAYAIYVVFPGQELPAGFGDEDEE